MVKLYINTTSHPTINYFPTPYLGECEAKRLMDKFLEIVSVEMTDTQTGRTIQEFVRR